MAYQMIYENNMILTDPGLFEPILESTPEGSEALRCCRLKLQYEEVTNCLGWCADDFQLSPN